MIKKRVSEQMPVIECSEFRTFKLFLDCGRVAETFNYGVTYCTDRGHHHMANRDVVAARKIGARYLGKIELYSVYYGYVRVASYNALKLSKTRVISRPQETRLCRQKGAVCLCPPRHSLSSGTILTVDVSASNVPSHLRSE